MIGTDPNGPLLVLDGPWVGRILAAGGGICEAVVQDDPPPVDSWPEVSPLSYQKVRYYKVQSAVWIGGSPHVRYFWYTNRDASVLDIFDAAVTLAARAGTPR